MKFKTEKSQVLHLGRNDPMHQYVLGADQMESILSEKDLEVLLNTSLDMSQKTALVIRRQTTSWTASGRTSPAGQWR